MNKTELIKAIAKEANMTQADAQKFLNAWIEVVKNTLKKEEPIQLTGFGTFKVTERKARNGINPQTGKKIKIKAKKVPKFVPGKFLKEAVK